MAYLTHIPGASDVVDYGFVTYSDSAKSGILSIPKEILKKHGSVSEPVSRLMAEGALRYSTGACIALSTSGNAGPTGSSSGSPVGLVHFALARHGYQTQHQVKHYNRQASREVIRELATRDAIQMILCSLQNE